jgi:hypothetical protein
MDPKYAHHIFWQFASEYFGDLRALSQLFAAYKDYLCNVYRATAKSSTTDRPSKLPNFNGEGAKMFFAQFDNISHHSFQNCFTNFNDYSMPILNTTDFTIYLNLSKHIFIQQWALLPSHRNINRERDGNNLTEFKEQQVFIALLMLQ